MKRLSKSSMKKGAASLYVVIFTTILFGVITLSFIRIILSESSQSSNDDLSRSAYDSALAGVEDAKIAVNKYYKCREDPSGSDCSRYLVAGALFGEDDPTRNNCENFKLKALLYPGSTDSEVKIQESSTNGNNTDQAYTCVIINNVVADYRSTLTSDTRTKVIPLGVNADKLSEVRRVEFRWYSEINGTDFTSNLNPPNVSDPSWPYLEDKNHTTVPPVISLTLLRTGKDIIIGNYNNATNRNYSTMILRPVSSPNGTNNISASEIEAAGDATSANGLFKINCEHGEFACTVNLDTYISSKQYVDFYTRDYLNILSSRGVDISGYLVYTDDTTTVGEINSWPNVISGTAKRESVTGEYTCEVVAPSGGCASYYKNPDGSNMVTHYKFSYDEKGAGFFEDGGNAFLIVSLPYGETVTDFVVTLYDKNDEVINFENVQISVDSTGRANQLLRRVETRLDPSDSFFPYPDYEVTLGGNGDDSLSKNYWITYNCWTEGGPCDNNGNL